MMANMRALFYLRKQMLQILCQYFSQLWKYLLFSIVRFFAYRISKIHVLATNKDYLPTVVMPLRKPSSLTVAVLAILNVSINIKWILYYLDTNN